MLMAVCWRGSGTARKKGVATLHPEGESVPPETQYLETLYQQKLTALAELKQSILHKAFAGELTASVEEDSQSGDWRSREEG